MHCVIAIGSRYAHAKGTNEAPARNWIELGPEVAARMALVSEPAAAIVLCYTLTRGAERAWSAINSQLTQPRGELFWIGGAAGTGKTHFLNYAVALSNRAAASDTASGRYLTVIADAERAGTGNWIGKYWNSSRCSLPVTAEVPRFGGGWTVLRV